MSKGGRTASPSEKKKKSAVGRKGKNGGVGAALQEKVRGNAREGGEVKVKRMSRDALHAEWKVKGKFCKKQKACGDSKKTA